MELVKVVVQLGRPALYVPYLSVGGKIMYCVEKNLQITSGDKWETVDDVCLQHHVLFARVASDEQR